MFWCKSMWIETFGSFRKFLSVDMSPPVGLECSHRYFTSLILSLSSYLEHVWCSKPVPCLTSSVPRFKCSLWSWNVLCTFNPSQALLSGCAVLILCLWSLLLKADPGDVGARRLIQTQRQASWTGLNGDSQSGIGFPKGFFSLTPVTPRAVTVVRLQPQGLNLRLQSWETGDFLLFPWKH